MPTRRKSHWARLIQQPVERIGDAVKPVKRRGDQQRSRQGVLDGEPFRPQFAQDDLQKGRDGKTDGEGGRILDVRRMHAEPVQGRREQRHENRFAPASPDRGWPW